MPSIETRIRSAHLTRRLMRVLLAAAAMLGACGGDEDRIEAIACTTEVLTSVLLTVVDPINAPLPGVTATYRVDGGATQSKACEPNGTCAIGEEVSGVFSITASKAGYVPSSVAITVRRDECHVITERLTLTLLPTP